MKKITVRLVQWRGGLYPHIDGELAAETYDIIDPELHTYDDDAMNLAEALGFGMAHGISPDNLNEQRALLDALAEHIKEHNPDSIVIVNW